MTGRDPTLFEAHATRFFPERHRDITTDGDAERLDDLLRAIDIPTSYDDGSEVVAVPRHLLADIAGAIASLIKGNERMRQAMDEFGTHEDEVHELIQMYHDIVMDKYEHDRDERIILAALILHLVEGNPSQSSKARSVNLARKALGDLGEPPAIDEPVDEEYAKQLIDSLDG